jgi:hypothetical protein
MVWESSLILKEKYMRATGLMIKHMVLALMYIQMEQNMRECGDMTFSMDRAKKHGLMDPSLLVNMQMARRMVEGSISG